MEIKAWSGGDVDKLNADSFHIASVFDGHWGAQNESVEVSHLLYTMLVSCSVRTVGAPSGMSQNLVIRGQFYTIMPFNITQRIMALLLFDTT